MKTSNLPYKIIRTEKELDKLIAFCKQTGYACIDFETTSTEFQNPNEYPTILGVSFQPGSAWIIPLGHFESPFKQNFPKILRKFSREVLEDINITKVGWNFKFEEKWLIRYGCKVIGRVFDGMMAKYLLDEERPFGLKEIVRKLVPDFKDYEYEVSALVKKHGWAGVPLDKLSLYCAKDCHLEFLLMLYFEKRLIKGGFYDLFRNLIMPRIRGLAECEYSGALIDKAYLEKLMNDYETKIVKLEKQLKSHIRLKKFERKEKRLKIKLLIQNIQAEIDELEESDKPNKDRLIKNREDKIQRITMGELSKKETYEGLNFASPSQLVRFFFTSRYGLKFPILKYTLDKNNQPTDTPSTDEETLLKLAKKDKSGFINALLELRGLQKLYSTYIKGTYQLLDHKNRIHPSFQLHGTVTGRASCVSPNLQNIPRDTTSSDIKKMFIAPKGHVLLELDYSQAELRVVAEIANEPTMLEWFRTGRNIHVASACRANKVEDRYDEILKITKNEDHPDHVFWTKKKKIAKTINFGILYEQSPMKLKETLEKDGEKVSVDEAQRYMDNWFKDFPRIKKFIQNQHRMVKAQGYVKTMFGQKRRLPDIYSSHYGKMLAAQRQSSNSPIQGTAAQFGHFSSVIIRQRRMTGQLRGITQEVYNVHDSLGFYVKPEYLHELVPQLVEICANPETKQYFGFELKKVKMQVNAEVALDWGNLRGYKETEDYTKLR
jgi:DNA polymerase-1